MGQAVVEDFMVRHSHEPEGVPRILGNGYEKDAGI